MNAGPTSGRVHQALRQMILNRTLRPGARLDPAILSELLAASATPVREALSVLCGEGLVTARPGDGFHVPMIDAPGLADLYAWNDAVLGLIQRRVDRLLLADHLAVADPAADIAERTADLTEWIASASANEEHLRAVRDLNARLYAARLVEPLCIDDVEEELSRLTAAARSADLTRLQKGWRLYHRRRVRAASRILRALLRD